MINPKASGTARLLRQCLAGTLLVVFAIGCAHKMKEVRLQDVAKNWCETIRASQIIAVYPLTEDLQPGDVFLVQLPIQEQQKAYNGKGFLPLDQLVHRIQPTGYVKFYERSFAVGDDNTPLPKYWLANWAKAPNAKFPTYTFSVRSGGGFNLALPVQGVPIGLSLMGADAAEGTITIGDSYTFGVDADSLYDQLVEWARDHQQFLSSFAPKNGAINYLRVVTRVYSTKQLNVSLQSSRQMAAGVTAGAPKPIDLIVPKAGADQEATLTAYKTNISALNDLIAAARTQAEGVLPGGTLKVASASSGSISLIETFPRPLVIGYVGFDSVIGYDGLPGPPFSSYAVLEGTGRPETAPESTSELFSNAALSFVYAALNRLKQEGDRKAEGLVAGLDNAANLLPPGYPCTIWGLGGASGPLIIRHKVGDQLGKAERSFAQITELRGKLIDSIDAIRYAQQNPSVTIEGSYEKARLVDELNANVSSLTAINASLKKYSTMIKSAVLYAIALPHKER